VSEQELRERREREAERGAEAEGLGAKEELDDGGGTTAVPTHALFRGIGRRGVRGRVMFFSFVLLLSPLFFPSRFSLVRNYYFSGEAWAEGKRGACKSRRARTADRKRTVHNLAMI